MLLTLRNVLFYTVYWLSLPIFSFTGLLLWPVTSYRWRSAFVTLWNRLVVWWLKITCGASYEIRGRENLPNTPCVVLANHQSAWETLALQFLFSPASTVLKRELLNLPVFGWGLRAMEPIAIDRSNPREALKAVKAQGQARLASGNHVLIFPEGTRSWDGKLLPFKKGGFVIAQDGQLPILPITICGSHQRLPKGSAAFSSGEIEIVIHPPMASGALPLDDLMTDVRNSIASSL